MSNIAMRDFRFDSTLFVLLLASAFAGCSFKTAEPDLPLGLPVLHTFGAAGQGPFSRLSIAMRPPGIPAWSAKLEKGSDGFWRITERSDHANPPGELADSKLIEHFLEVAGTFLTEALAGTGNDAVYGLTPYRMEIRIGEAASPVVLRIGGEAGANVVYFRRGDAETKTWIGRGALIQFLPTVESIDSLTDKSPFLADLDQVESVRLTKREAPNAGIWEFLRRDGHWYQGQTPLAEEKDILVERIFRQRLVRLLPHTDAPELRNPDWEILARTKTGEEKLEIAFPLNSVIAGNTARSDRPMELYPEIAGALRAFTQARFTSFKSATK
jgi:hypothetical protein